MILDSWTEIWVCSPPTAAAHIYHVAVTHKPPLRFRDLTPADAELKLSTISLDDSHLLLGSCTVNGDAHTCVEWSVEPPTLAEFRVVIAEFLERVRSRGHQQRLRPRPVGFRANE